MPLRFAPHVLELAYDAKAAPVNALEVRPQEIPISKEEIARSKGELFRMGSQVFVDPPRSVQVTDQWQQILADSGCLKNDEKDVHAIIVAVRDLMLSSREPHEVDISSYHLSTSNYVYSILLHRPSSNACTSQPKEGDKVILTVAATTKFVGGVLKSRGCPEGAPPTFPLGAVIGASGTQVKVRLLEGEDFSWYDRADLEVICDWQNKFKENIPEGWLRDARSRFSSQIEQWCLQDMFQSDAVHRIPVFQRRYCWTQLQWSELWKDLLRMKCASAEVANHSLGRVLLREREDGSRLILDGQQRLTTISLLLAALRDRLSSLGHVQDAQSLHTMLGNERLIPTLDDRADFRRCLQEVYPHGDGPLLEAKRFFSSLCEEVDGRGCTELVTVFLQRFSLMTFILQSDRRLQVIYHMMSNGWCPEGSTPGIEMSPVDFIRNFVLEFFADDHVKRKMHSEHWSPLEVHLGSVESMEHFFKDFLASQGFQAQRSDLYDTFEDWWKSKLLQQSDLAEYAVSRLQEIHEFLK